MLLFDLLFVLIYMKYSALRCVCVVKSLLVAVHSGNAEATELTAL